LILICREDRIRTCDPLVPNQVRYRPALLPEFFVQLFTLTMRPWRLSTLRYRLALLHELLTFRKAKLNQISLTSC
jgi:hypothetical protein